MATKATPTTASHSPWVTRRWTMTPARATTATIRTHFRAVAHGGGLAEPWYRAVLGRDVCLGHGYLRYCGQVVRG